MSVKQGREKLRENSNQDHREKATDTHSASWWRRVTRLAGLILISSSLLGSQVAAEDNVPYPYRNCTDPTNHDEKVKGCGLWRSIEKSCINWDHTQLQNPHYCYNRFENLGNPPVVIVQEKDCHFLAVPTVPVIGVEDASNRDKYPYWHYAWLAAAIPADPKKIKDLKKSIGLAINPVKHRTQHQLHIHIGCLTKDMRDLFSEKHIPHNGKWYKLSSERVYNKTCYAKFVKSDPFPSPFKEVSEHFGEANMQHAGIMLAGHVEHNDELKGFYIVSCYDACVEKWLNYHCGQQ